MTLMNRNSPICKVCRCLASLTPAATALAVGLQATACPGPRSRELVVVELQQIPDSAPPRWWGLTNIFFDSIPSAIRDSVRLGRGWTAAELADVLQGDGLVTIYAARFRAPGEPEIQYVVDTNGDRDFTNDQPLMFRHSNKLKVADIVINVRTQSGAHRRVPYQVLLSDDGYTYARIADYRQGWARMGGRAYAVKVRSAYRNHPFYGRDDGTVFSIDLNGDGTITEQTDATVRGSASSAEQVEPGTPFLLAGRQYEISGIDSAGSRLTFLPSSARVAAAVGFEAPELTTRLLSRTPYRLSNDRGKVVLIEFWSVNCPYSEVARAPLNELAARLRANGFSWIAVAREDEPGVVQTHLQKHPMSAAVALHDSTAWAVYDHAIATPLFYVVDQHGRVQLRALGASAVAAVAAKVSELIGPTPTPPAGHR